MQVNITFGTFYLCAIIQDVADEETYAFGHLIIPEEIRKFLWNITSTTIRIGTSSTIRSTKGKNLVGQNIAAVPIYLEHCFMGIEHQDVYSTPARKTFSDYEKLLKETGVIYSKISELEKGTPYTWPIFGPLYFILGLRDMAIKVNVPTDDKPRHIIIKNGQYDVVNLRKGCIL